MTGGVLIRYVAAALLCAMFLTPALAAPAYAHTELDNAVPADGVTLERSPGSIQLDFTEPVDAELSSVVVRGPDGDDLTEGPARQSGPGLIQPMHAAARAGTVEVAYRVVSLDGHPVSGSYTFEVLRGDPGAATGGPGGEDETGDEGAAAGDFSLLGPLLGAVAVAVLVAAGALLARRRSRTARPETAVHTTPTSRPTPS